MNTNTAITTAENYGSYVKVDRELLTVKNVTSKTIFKVLEECTELGKFFTPALSSILDLFIGAKPDPTQEKLDKINDKIQNSTRTQSTGAAFVLNYSVFYVLHFISRKEKLLSKEQSPVYYH